MKNMQNIVLDFEANKYEKVRKSSIDDEDDILEHSFKFSTKAQLKDSHRERKLSIDEELPNAQEKRHPHRHHQHSNHQHQHQQHSNHQHQHEQHHQQHHQHQHEDSNNRKREKGATKIQPIINPCTTNPMKIHMNRLPHLKIILVIATYISILYAFTHKILTLTASAQQSLLLQYDLKHPPNNNLSSSLFKDVWLYLPQLQPPTYLTQIIVDNIKRYANSKQYTLHILNDQNYKEYFINPQLLQDYESFLLKLENALKEKEVQPSQMNEIRQKLLWLYMLYQHGGVCINNNVILIQNLQWLEQLEHNRFVMKASHQTPPQVFYFSEETHRRESRTYHHPTNNITFIYQQYFLQFPAIWPHFLASIAQSSFIDQLLEQYKAVVSSAYDVSSEISSGQEIQCLSSKYKVKTQKVGCCSMFLMAGHAVLDRRQRYLDRLSSYNNYTYAIEYYGIYTINRFYFASKLQFMLKDKYFYSNNIQKYYFFLAQLQIQELTSYLGSFKYIFQIQKLPQLSHLITKILEENHNKSIQISQNSFLQKYLFPFGHPKLIYHNQNKQNNHNLSKNNILFNEKNNSLKWDQLEKKVWVYWDSGIKNANKIIQRCIMNIQSYAKQSNFTLIVVSQQNIKNYLSADILERIDLSIRSSQLLIFPQTRSDLIRLNLLKEYGGIYLDASFFLTQNLDWILNINENELIINKYGDFPDAVMMTFYCTEWSLNEFRNQVDLDPLIENSFIAAKRNSTLINHWLQQFYTFLSMSYSEVDSRMKTYCPFIRQKWTDSLHQYLIAMQSLRCVLANKRIELANYHTHSNPSHFYKLWLITGLIGPVKFRPLLESNAADPASSPLLWRYPQSYSEEIVGKINYGIKLFSGANKEVELLTAHHQVDPNSFFAKYFKEKSGLIP